MKHPRDPVGGVAPVGAGGIGRDETVAAAPALLDPGDAEGPSGRDASPGHRAALTPPVVGSAGASATGPAVDPESIRLICSQTPARVIEALSTMSKRGRLAGYQTLRQPSSSDPGGAYRVLAFGGIYDHEMLARVEPNGAGSRVEFKLRLLRKMPVIAVVLIVVSIFPGLQITDSMLKTYFSWYQFETAWWYIPLVVLTVPFMWKQYRDAVKAVRIDAAEVIRKMGVELGARIE